MKLRTPSRERSLISLVPMIDVMLILLVFFMVTSTYLNLDMIPALERSEAAEAAPLAAAPGTGGEGGTLLIRLGPDGAATVRGSTLDPEALAEMVANRVAADPEASVVILPSGRATTQSLVSLMDLVTVAGASRLRIIRLEASP